MKKDSKYIGYLNKVSIEIRKTPLADLERKLIVSLADDQDLTYYQIAEKLKYTSGYIGDIARELFGLLTQKHHVKVTRTNIFSTLDAILSKEPDDTFYVCHNIKEARLLNQDIITFKSTCIMVNLSSYWKFNATNQTLILKHQYPIIIDISEITIGNLGEHLLLISNREQLSGDALIELIKIIRDYLQADDVK
jgi:hypothetical protein